MSDLKQLYCRNFALVVWSFHSDLATSVVCVQATEGGAERLYVQSGNSL